MNNDFLKKEIENNHEISKKRIEKLRNQDRSETHGIIIIDQKPIKDLNRI